MCQVMSSHYIGNESSQMNTVIITYLSFKKTCKIAVFLNDKYFLSEKMFILNSIPFQAVGWNFITVYYVFRLGSKTTSFRNFR